MSVFGDDFDIREKEGRIVSSICDATGNGLTSHSDLMNQLAVLLDVRVRRLAAQDIDRAAFQIVWLSSVPEERTRALLAHAPGSLIPVERSEEQTSELQSLMRISYAVF